MKPALLKRLAILLTTATVASMGCAHAQRPEKKVYVIAEDASAVGIRADNGTGGSGAEAYCNELQKQCFTKCWNRKPKLSSIPKGSGKHNEYCTELCLQEFMNCIKQQEELERQESKKQSLDFPNMDTALGWLRNHTADAPPGTTVVVTGVVFVVAIVAGALVLAPL